MLSQTSLKGELVMQETTDWRLLQKKPKDDYATLFDNSSLRRLLMFQLSLLFDDSDKIVYSWSATSRKSKMKPVFYILSVFEVTGRP